MLDSLSVDLNFHNNIDLFLKATIEYCTRDVNNICHRIIHECSGIEEYYADCTESYCCCILTTMQMR